MRKYSLKLSLKSPTLIGSGEGFGALIDTDVVFDQTGIPFIPAKRIKGCLRDSAQEIKEILELSQTESPLLIEETFGRPGSLEESSVCFSNLVIEEYESNLEWLRYFSKDEDYGKIVSREQILSFFTEIRQQTRIGTDGVAEDHTLRTLRVIQKGITFCGEIQIKDNSNPDMFFTLALACRNFKRMGAMRNRGFGEIGCFLLMDEQEKEVIEKRLEEICQS